MNTVKMIYFDLFDFILSPLQGGNDTTYVCANNNSNVNFFTALLDKGVLTINNTVSWTNQNTVFHFGLPGTDFSLTV